ncbi:Pyridoxal phosphate-dependent decarboxylase [Trinorchestia longiramus]|nr:Pyridoxal phosphate-dependent decarboxylase [Trinorchestia longiramus]
MQLCVLSSLSAAAKTRINEACEGQPAWKIVLITAGGTASFIALKNFLWQDESLYVRGKNTVFSLVRRIPAVQRKIKGEIEKMEVTLSAEMNAAIDYTAFKVELPKNGWKKDSILQEVKNYSSLGKYNYASGYISGTFYSENNPELNSLMTEVYGLTAWSNPLHADVFPGIRKMEAEVVRICCELFNGGPDSCGTMTIGGTESIIMACKAFRDYAVSRGVTTPEILVPVTAHAAFDKGAQLLNIRIKHAPVDPVTMRADVKAMRRMITRNTCMLVGSAPQFPHGVLDPIKEISELGLAYGIPVHVDACLGGFLIPFMKDAGFPLPPFDFSLPGVCSISCDTHKYGFAPKGSSVIMYRSREYRHHQFFAQPDWPGGIYATPTIAGSRAGGIIAACWAALMYYGRDGYIKTTKAIVSTAKYIEEQCRLIPNLEIVGKAEVSVVALSSKCFNIYSLSDKMGERGWNLSALQFPSSIHIALTMAHTKPGIAEKFVKDLREIAEELSKLPRTDDEGSAALYCMAQSLPDRSIVGEITRCYLDISYDTSPHSAGKAPAAKSADSAPAAAAAAAKTPDNAPAAAAKTPDNAPAAAAKTPGSAALYCMAQSLPDRSIVGEITRCYLDISYDTSPHSAGKAPAAKSADSAPAAAAAKTPDNAPAAAAKTPDNAPAAAAKTPGSAPAAAAKTPDNPPAAAAKTPGNAPAAAAKTPGNAPAAAAKVNAISNGAKKEAPKAQA